MKQSVYHSAWNIFYFRFAQEVLQKRFIGNSNPLPFFDAIRCNYLVVVFGVFFQFFGGGGVQCKKCSIPFRIMTSLSLTPLPTMKDFMAIKRMTYISLHAPSRSFRCSKECWRCWKFNFPWKLGKYIMQIPP